MLKMPKTSTSVSSISTEPCTGPVTAYAPTMMVKAKRICGKVMAGSSKRLLAPDRKKAYQKRMLTKIAPERILTSPIFMKPVSAAYSCRQQHATNTLAAISDRMMRRRCLGSVPSSRSLRRLTSGLYMAARGYMRNFGQRLQRLSAFCRFFRFEGVDARLFNCFEFGREATSSIVGFPGLTSSLLRDAAGVKPYENRTNSLN